MSIEELQAEVARLREHYDEAIRANTEAVTENARLRNTDTYQKCQSLIKERDEREEAARWILTKLRERLSVVEEGAMEIGVFERWPWLKKDTDD